MFDTWCTALVKMAFKRSLGVISGARPDSLNVIPLERLLTSARQSLLFAFLVANYSSPFADSRWPSADDDRSLDAIVVKGQRPPHGTSGVLAERVGHSEAPVDIVELPQSTLAEPGARTLSSVLSRDAALGENYATTGYYENFTVRGFTLDLGSAYRINGFVVPGEFHVPLENMESIEVLKGAGGLQGGQVGASGAINFLTRRPEKAGSATAELSGTGGSRVILDIGDGIAGQTGLGVRFVAAHEEMRPSQPKANGQRSLIGAAFEVRPTSDVRFLIDLIAQERSQPAIPGFQLLGGTTLPDSGVRDININQQPWSRPVRNAGVMGSIRTEWQLSPVFWMRGGIAHTAARIDDNLATPWGCNTSPVQYFCANGDYVLYDYHARERRETQHMTGSLHGLAQTGILSHAVTLGLERIDRKVRQDDLYSATIYDPLGNALSGNLATTATPLPAPVGMGASRVPTTATQTAGIIADRISLGDFSVLASLRLVEVEQQPSGIRGRHALPQFAVTWHYESDRNLYVSTGRSLEFGAEAPLTAANAGTLMAPRLTRQVEAGWKAKAPSGMEWMAAVFRMERPYEFTEPVGTSWAGLGNYIRAGQQVHQGLDASWRTAPDVPFRLEGSQAVIKATATATGFSRYENVQIQNVPYFNSFVRASQAWPGAPGVDVHLDWIYRGRRNARRDGAVSVPGYNVFNAGIAWRQEISGRSAVTAVTVRNVTDRRYWRDVGEAYSADLLFPGEPRSIVASLSIPF